MAYDTHWQRMERWKVTKVDNMGSTLAVDDELRFEVSAGGTDNDKLIRINHVTKVETVWGKKCIYNSGTDEIELDNALGHFVIGRTAGTLRFPPKQAAELRCEKDSGPTGTGWTAEEQLPPP